MNAVSGAPIAIQPNPKSSLHCGRFIFGASIILMVAGAVKLWGAFGNSKILTVADPIVEISFKHLLLAAGALEIVIATICLCGKSRKWSLALIAWRATSFFAYRLGLWWIFFNQQVLTQ